MLNKAFLSTVWSLDPQLTSQWLSDLFVFNVIKPSAAVRTSCFIFLCYNTLPHVSHLDVTAAATKTCFKFTFMWNSNLTADNSFVHLNSITSMGLWLMSICFILLFTLWTVYCIMCNLYRVFLLYQTPILFIVCSLCFTNPASWLP